MTWLEKGRQECAKAGRAYAVVTALAIASFAGVASADPRTYVWADGLFGGKGVLVTSQGWSCATSDGVTAPDACKSAGETRIEIVRPADAYSHEFADALKAGRIFKTLTLQAMDGYPPSGTVLTVSDARVASESVDDKGVERISVAFRAITDDGLFYDEGRPAVISQVPLAIRAFTPAGPGKAP